MMTLIFRPWKQEWAPPSRHTLEFSMWKVCRVTHKGEVCYDGEYDGAPGKSFFEWEDAKICYF